VDVRYRTSPEVVPDSKLTAIPALHLLSKTLRSESDGFTRRATGSCAVHPGPAPSRILTFLESRIGDLLVGVRKRRVCIVSLISSNVARRRLTEATVWGGAMDVAVTRPVKGSSGIAGF
jgi:hypothetical protein